MKPLRIALFLQMFISSINAYQVAKEGLIPSFTPHELSIAIYFLPHNPNVLIVGDKISYESADIASTIECSSVFSISSTLEDLDSLSQYANKYRNIHPFFGTFNGKTEGNHRYYPTLPHREPYENFLRFPGSLLEPNDQTYSFLFGESIVIPTFSLKKWREEQNISRLHYIRLNSGGNELQMLQSDKQIVENAIVVLVKTYHQPIRKNITSFNELHQYMMSLDFELLSHYIYDNVIGDALFVKRKYVNAVFRSKEI